MRTLFGLILCVSSYAQTTSIMANTPIIDRFGALLTGSICLGPILYNPGVPCQNIVAGSMTTYTVPNATYAIWINEGFTPIFTITGIPFTGTTITTDTYLSGQFGLQVGVNYVFSSQANPNIITAECNGNAVVFPGNPTSGMQLQITNSSVTTACSLSGNNATLRYKGATLSPLTLAAQASLIAVWTTNYDQAGAGHNAWLISHIGA